MTQYKSNLFANFAGSGVAALLQLAFIPFYIKFLGIEAYGLIGFYIMLQAVLQVLDLGLGPTMNREMAQYSVQPDKVRGGEGFHPHIGNRVLDPRDLGGGRHRRGRAPDRHRMDQYRDLASPRGCARFDA